MIDVPGKISMKAGIKSGGRIVSWSIRSILSLVRQKIVSSQRKKSVPISGPSQISNHKFATATHKRKWDGNAPV